MAINIIGEPKKETKAKPPAKKAKAKKTKSVKKAPVKEKKESNFFGV